MNKVIGSLVVFGAVAFGSVEASAIPANQIERDQWYTEFGRSETPRNVNFGEPVTIGEAGPCEASVTVLPNELRIEGPNIENAGTANGRRSNDITGMACPGISAEVAAASIGAECDLPFGSIEATVKAGGIGAEVNCEGISVGIYGVAIEATYATPEAELCGITAQAEATAGAQAGVKFAISRNKISIGPITAGLGVRIVGVDWTKLGECLMAGATATTGSGPGAAFLRP